MVDAAVDTARLIFEKLMWCKEQYEDLAQLSEDLSEQLQQLLHLCEQRQREPRFAGAVQRHFSKRLKMLGDDIERILNKRQGGFGAKALLFFGSLWGSGAAADKLALQGHNDAIDKLLTKLQVEAGTITASATEELAGGTAAKFIKTEAMQRFWRSQFKNELKLPWETFRETLMMLEGLRPTFPWALTAVLNTIRGKMDRSGDDMIHVSEFSELFTPADIYEQHTVLDVIRYHLLENKRILLPALTLAPTSKITHVAQRKDLMAFASEDGFVKLYLNSASDADGVTLVSQIALPQQVSALTVDVVGDSLCVLAGQESQVHLYDAWSGSFIESIEISDIPKLLVVRGDFLFIAALDVSARAQVLRRIPNTKKFHLQSALHHMASVRHIVPLTDRLVLCATTEHGAIVWDYILGTAIFQIPIQRLGNPVLKFSNDVDRFVVVGHKNKDIVSIVVEISEEDLGDHAETPGHVHVAKSKFTILTADAGDEIIAAGHSFLILKDQSVKVIDYTVNEKTGAVQISGRRQHIVPKIVHYPQLFSLQSRSGFIVVGKIFGFSNPIWMIFDHGAKTPVVGVPCNWSPLDSHMPMGKWMVRNHPAVTVTNADGKKYILSSCFSKKIRLSSFASKSTAFSIDFEQSLETKKNSFSSYITAIINDGCDVIVATADGWILRYDFTTAPTSDEKSKPSSLVEVSNFLEKWADLTPQNARDAVRAIPLLSQTTHRLIRAALAAGGLLETIADEFDKEKCGKFISVLVGLKTQLITEYAKKEAPTSNSTDTMCDYFIASRWAEPVAKTWIFDGEEHCSCCNVPLQPIEYVAQTCHSCCLKRVGLGKCFICDAYSGNFVMCDPCYDKQRDSMRLYPMGLAVCNGQLLVGCCVDSQFYGPAGGTLMKLSAKTLQRVDRLSRSYVPFYSNMKSVNTSKYHFFIAPISYCTIAVIDGEREKIVSSILTTYSQPQLCQSVAVDISRHYNKPLQQDDEVFDVFSSTIAVDLLWRRVKLSRRDSQGIVIPTRATSEVVTHVTKNTSVFTMLNFNQNYVFASDKIGGTAIFLRRPTELQPLLYCQSQVFIKLCHSTFFDGNLLTFGIDGTVGVTPLNMIEDIADTMFSEESHNRTKDKKSFMIINGPDVIQANPGLLVDRIDKTWKWKRYGTADPFTALNDVQKNELIAALRRDKLVLLRFPDALSTETMSLEESQGCQRMTLKPSHREVISVVEFESQPKEIPPGTQAFIGSEHLQPIDPDTPFVVTFDKSPELSAPNRKWLSIRLFSKTKAMLQVHSPSDAFVPQIITVNPSDTQASEIFWIALGNAPVDRGVILSSLDFPVILKRSPAICEKRCIKNSPMLYIEM